MLLVKPTANYFFLCVVCLFSFSNAFTQENSPFSRYGLGDLYPQQNISTRGMGGISAGVTDAQSINTLNPASYGYLTLVTYDLGLSIDARTLNSTNPVGKYNSTNFLPSYLQLGIPLNHKGASLVFGLRPYTRINYSVEEGSEISYDSLGVNDSLHTLYEGNGGLNQAFIGLAKRWGDPVKDNFNLAIGVNGGYEWGSKYTSTKIDFPADSSYQNWYRSNSTDTTRYGSLFLSPGILMHFLVGKKTNPLTKNIETYDLNIGASGTLEQDLDATRTITNQTFQYADDGSIILIDSVSKIPKLKGKITVPLTYTAGFVLNKNIGNSIFQVKKWSIGADYTSTKWTNYRYYGQPDQLNDSWFLHSGVSFSPDPLSGKGMFATGTYSLGFYTGKDYINADGNGYKVQAYTFGFAFNLRKFRSYDKQFTKISTALEYGKRGTGVNNITENFFKLSVGLSLSDIWFIKRKYD
jgi:hypothetical protein